jgi:hypothetical protein
MKVGDLVTWSQGYCEMPGLVLETKSAKKLQTPDASLSPVGLAVLALLPELSEPEWFHERELEVVNESR